MAHLNTIIAFLITAIGISFLCSLTSFLKLQKLAKPTSNFLNLKKSLFPSSRLKTNDRLIHRHCTHWLIIPNATENELKHLNHFLKFEDWCILVTVVFGNANLPNNCLKSRCAFFALQQDRTNTIPTNTIWPYDYVVRNGAKFVLTLDPTLPIAFYENILEYPFENEDQLVSGLVAESATAGSVLLENFETIDKAATKLSITYKLYETRPATSIQNFYLVSPNSQQPSVTIGQNIYTRIENGQTVYSYNAFWALIPLSDRIVKSFWALRLMREIDEHLIFIPTAKTILNLTFQTLPISSTNYRLVIDFLHNWVCPIDFVFVECIILLSKEMTRKEFWSRKDAKLVGTWIDQLTTIGYRFPKRQLSIDRVGRRVNFVDKSKEIGSIEHKTKSLQSLTNFCTDFNVTPSLNAPFAPIYHYDDIVLVITFNHPHHSNIPLLLALYEPWFSNVIFCSTFESNEIFDSFFFGQWTLSNISYINVTKVELFLGSFSYICLAHVIDMQLSNVRGYLVVGDDALLNFWTHLDGSKPRAHFGSCETLLDFPSLWWFSEYGETALKKVRALIYNERQNLRLSYKAKQNLKNILVTSSWCASDIYYVSFDKARDYGTLAKLFFRGGAFLEIVVPKIMAALGATRQYALINTEEGKKTLKKTSDIRGKYLWRKKDRARPFQAFDEKAHFIHPFKMSWLNETNWQNLFCNRYVDALFRAVYQ